MKNSQFIGKMKNMFVIIEIIIVVVSILFFALVYCSLCCLCEYGRNMYAWLRFHLMTRLRAEDEEFVQCYHDKLISYQAAVLARMQVAFPKACAELGCETCAICMEELSGKEIHSICPANGHFFHKICVNSEARCPLCFTPTLKWVEVTNLPYPDTMRRPMSFHSTNVEEILKEYRRNFQLFTREIGNI